ncbi:MAG: lanthionine synthetase LanC family protein [Marinifilaceae bacterium]
MIGLETLEEYLLEEISKPDSVSELSLYSGLAGKIYSLQYYYLLTKDPKVLEILEERVAFLMENIEQVSMTTFCNGLSGVLYCLNDLRKNELISISEEDLAIADAFLFENFEHGLLNNDCDFFHGLTGVGSYFLMRARDTGEYSQVKYIVNAILSNIKNVKGFKTWKKLPYMEEDEEVIDLGFAHGLPSILLFLASVAENNIRRQEIEEVIASNFDLLKRVKNLNTTRTFFPDGISDEFIGNTDSSRLAYCYGDIGIAFSLLRCGEILNRVDYIEEAERIVENTLSFYLAEEVDETCFCHGLAGLILFYKYFAVKFKKPVYEEVSNHWRCLLEQKWRQYGENALDFTSYSKERGYYKETNTGLLEGYCGVFLVCISDRMQFSNILRWSKCFLINP